MIKSIVAKKINTAYLIHISKFMILLAVATGGPLAGIHSQWITGPIVNMALILTVSLLGVREALLIGLLPSVIALSIGLLPVALAPMIPFIIISNTVLVLTINWFKNHKSNYWVSLLIGSGLKFLFLFLASNLIIGLLLSKPLAQKVAVMMSWPQFFTALIGGILSWIIIKKLKNKKI
jgi:hypothetical protein